MKSEKEREATARLERCGKKIFRNEGGTTVEERRGCSSAGQEAADGRRPMGGKEREERVWVAAKQISADLGIPPKGASLIMASLGCCTAGDVAKAAHGRPARDAATMPAAGPEPNQR